MANDKPNLLFLYTDEQRYDTMAAYGNTQIEMPNLNRFAGGAVVFDEAYVTQPVCTPSRSTLLTGQYPHTNGCTANNIPLREETDAAGGDSIRTIVTAEGWRYSHSSRGYHELFHLRDDPLETTNLASDPVLAPIREKLAGKIRRWQAETADRSQTT